MDFDPKKTYTVQDLIDLKLSDYVDLVNAIYKRAFLEQNNIQQFNQVEDLINNKLKFKLAKHFDIKLYNSGRWKPLHLIWSTRLNWRLSWSFADHFKLSKAASTLINRKQSTPSGRVSALKSISKQQVTEQNNLIANFNYKLVDLHEIRCTFDVNSSSPLNQTMLDLAPLIEFSLQDALIRLNLILQSQVKANLKDKVQNLVLRINEIAQLANMWLEVQHEVKLFPWQPSTH